MMFCFWLAGVKRLQASDGPSSSQASGTEHRPLGCCRLGANCGRTAEIAEEEGTDCSFCPPSGEFHGSRGAATAAVASNRWTNASTINCCRTRCPACLTAKETQSPSTRETAFVSASVSTGTTKEHVRETEATALTEWRQHAIHS